MVEYYPKVVPNYKPCTSRNRQYIPHRVLNMKEIIGNVALIRVLDDETKRNGAKQEQALHQIKDILTNFIIFFYVEDE